ncbi:glucokinase regulatory protein [Brachyhypopomus gauderio]|uniref:glucokinase regulatory protein n=1 Tax=Brachyhypopomus gauderio TaxID=698409 RepID=UPI0040426EB8
MEQWERSYEPSLPITEQSNPITVDIDRASPEEIVQMLKKCDAEIFERTVDAVGQKLNNWPIVQTMTDVSKRVEKVLKDPEDSMIILSGCGTSGRVAFLLSTCFNRRLAALHQKQICSYIIAGGDKALLTSQESPEDSASLGALMLEKACTGKKHILFFGISCGLSAPFVAGQLNFCLNKLEIFTPVLIGFNPIYMARTEPMQDCPCHFKELVERMSEMQNQQKAFVLNPVVGPEALSGSSRMKGGSATKILLETILWAGCDAVYSKQAITPDGILASVKIIEKVHKITYSQSEKLAALIQKAGMSLREEGRVCYLGWQSLGIIGIIDGTECSPTFGAAFEDIRGFISNGFSEMKNTEGDLSPLGEEFIIGHEDFVNTVLPSLSTKDMVIFLFTVNDDLNKVSELARCVRQNTTNLHALAHDLQELCIPAFMQSMFTTILTFTWPSSLHEQNTVRMKQHWELSTKWCLNAISTGAHILKGKVYRNYMIDLRVSNSKLYKRALHMLEEFTGSTHIQCNMTLLRAIYGVEVLTDEMISADVIHHTLMAIKKDRVVPTALVMLRSGCTLAEARSRLAARPVIREAVAACLESP